MSPYFAETPCSVGYGAGAGPIFGFLTGDRNDMLGRATNYTVDLLLLGVTFTKTDTEWGLSGGVLGKGIGLGYYKNETYTTILDGSIRINTDSNGQK